MLHHPKSPKPHVVRTRGVPTCSHPLWAWAGTRREDPARNAAQRTPCSWPRWAACSARKKAKAVNLERCLRNDRSGLSKDDRGLARAEEGGRGWRGKASTEAVGGRADDVIFFDTKDVEREARKPGFHILKLYFHVGYQSLPKSVLNLPCTCICPVIAI